MDNEIPLKIRRKERNKKLFRYAAVLVAIILAILVLQNFLTPSLSSKDIITSEVSINTLSVTVNASGKAVPLSEEIIVAPINSRILEVYKNAGDSVIKGEAILSLELASIETEYKQKLDEREMRKSKLTQSKVKVDNTISEMIMQEKVKEMKLKQMHTELKNEKYLDSIGASTSDKVRQAALNYEVEKLELDQLRQKITNEQVNSSAEQNVQQLELSIFEKGLSENARLLKDARILSPRNATLTYVNNQIGSQVSVGTSIAIVSDLNNFKVEAEISDGYAEKLAAGAKATIKIGKMELTGTVVNITPSVKNGVINFLVMMDDSGNSKLRSGLKVDVYVEHGIKDSAVCLSNGSYYVGAGQYEMWIVKGNEAVKRIVELGESSFEYVEVRKGLEIGDKVIISDMTQHKSKKTLKINPVLNKKRVCLICISKLPLSLNNKSKQTLSW